MNKKEEGFKGQRTFVIPQSLISSLQNEAISQNLYITDIGFYPHARNHFRTRPDGCSQYILMYCVAGSGWIAIDEKKLVMKANQYLVIPAQKPHSYASSHDNPWTIYWIHYAGKHAPDYSPSSNEVLNIAPSSTNRINDRLTLFEEMIQNLEMGYSIDNLNYANICLAHFLASFRYLSQFRQINNKDFDLSDKSILFMKNKLDKKLTLDDLAHEAGLSVSQYSLAFRQKTGKSPIDYLIQLRIQKACQLLDHTLLSVKEIAQKVGYDDAYYFSRIFKKMMNVPPKEYRRNSKG
ncbi:MAG: AraC family transcriptional regulator [Mangrovibacterium sp.]